MVIGLIIQEIVFIGEFVKELREEDKSIELYINILVIMGEIFFLFRYFQIRFYCMLDKVSQNIYQDWFVILKDLR